MHINLMAKVYDDNTLRHTSINLSKTHMGNRVLGRPKWQLLVSVANPDSDMTVQIQQTTPICSYSS